MAIANPPPPCDIHGLGVDLSNILGTGKNTAADLYAQQNAGGLLDITSNPKFWQSWAGVPNRALTNGVQNGSTAFGAIVINGEFIVNQDCYIDHSEILMGPGGRITVKSGYHLYINDTYIHSCGDNETGVMWDSISVESGGLISFPSHVTIEDAEVGISLAVGSFYELYGSNFNLNYIGIRLIGNSNVNSPNVMEGLTFTSVAAVGSTTKATLLIPHTAQRSLVGIQVNNRTNFEISGPTALDKSTFRNLDYGIWAAKSSVVVGNTDFIDIDDPANPVDKNTDLGTGIYVKYPNKLVQIVPQMSLVVGGANTASMLKSCTFTNCKRGVYAVDNSHVNVSNNTFADCSFACSDINNGRASTINFQSNVCTNFYQGLRFINCINSPSFTVYGNTFAVSNPLNSGSFSNTGIFMVNKGIGYSGAVISENYFTDVRIGVYTNGIGKAKIFTNSVLFNRSFTDPTNGTLGLNHAGFWAESCDHTDYYDNTIRYTNLASVPVGQTAAFNAQMRGFNLKGHSNANVYSNMVTTCGTPLRLLDNMTQTRFTCNTFNGCTQGVLLDMVIMTAQGTLAKAAGNRWINYNPATFRVTGTCDPFNYFYEGSPSTSNVFYPYSNIPISDFYTFPNSGPSGCAIDPTGSDIDLSDVERVVLDSMITPDITDQEQERIATLILLKESLTNNVAYQNWMDSVENTETGCYARLVDSTSNRLNIAQALRALTLFRDPSFMVKRDLYADALTNQYFACDSIPIDTAVTLDLAFTNAWEGTSAVYLARAILEEEVDDVVMGLRVANFKSSQQGDCELNYALYNDQLTLFANTKTTVELFDTQGRLIQQFEISNQKELSRKALRDKQVIAVRMTNKNCQKSIQLQ